MSAGYYNSQCIKEKKIVMEQICVEELNACSFTYPISHLIPMGYRSSESCGFVSIFVANCLVFVYISYFKLNFLWELWGL